MLEWKKKFETMRDRVSELRRQGKSQEETAKIVKVDDLGWGSSALVKRSLPGLYEELGTR
jgi:hypothetical protein